jgi:hypothetical protein
VHRFSQLGSDLEIALCLSSCVWVHTDLLSLMVETFYRNEYFTIPLL